jgi:HK97 family phage portal protein
VSIFRSQRDLSGDYGDFFWTAPATGVPARPGTDGMAGDRRITVDGAMRHSAVWAAVRLRADLMSTFPVDVYRDLDGISISVTKPRVLINPGGDKWPMHHWLYATQADLDRCGNAFGIIRARDGNGLPTEIELMEARTASIGMRDGKKYYRFGNTEYVPEVVWHERQYPVAGFDLGLSPIAHAALSIGEHLSVQEFAMEWFGRGGVPRARMKNTKSRINNEAIARAKQWYRDTVSNGDLLVHGADWEYEMIQAAQQDAAWLELRRYGLADIARFFGVPADLIEAAVSGSTTITYANISQRNLQFLIMNLGPAVFRRQEALSNLTARPRFVRLNTDALLRMDPQTRTNVMAKRIESRVLAPSEARALDDMLPLSPEQIAEFDRLFGPPRAGATTPTVPVVPAKG